MSFQGRRSKRLPLDVDSRSKAEGCKEDRVVRMATNPLVAVDATSSRLLERELLRSWGAYLADGRLEQVRVPIAESWRRSQALGVDPFTSRAPTLLADRRDVRERWEAHQLGTRTPLIRRWLRPFADDSDYVIIVSDSHGMVLWIHGDVKLRSTVFHASATFERSFTSPWIHSTMP